MSERSVADIVHDLRRIHYCPDPQGAADEAADLLERLDRLDVLRPTCPTCDGSHRVPTTMADYTTGPYRSCPDCTDGRMSWERMAAIVTALFDRPDLADVIGEPVEYLRSVRP